MRNVVYFPGQGVRITKKILKYIEKFEVTEKICKVYNEVLGYSLRKILKKQLLLGDVDFIQPMIISINYIMWEILKLLKMPRPKIIAGHSLGEYSALVASGVIDIKSAISLAYLREKYMRLSCLNIKSGMAAITGVDFSTCEVLCRQAKKENEILDIACINSKNQIVISGYKNSIDEVIILAKKTGRVVRYIEVNTPAHSSLMKKAVFQFEKRIKSTNMKKPQIPIMHNTDARVYLGKEEIRASLLQQLTQPVQWLETMSKAERKDTGLVVECSHSGILGNFNRKPFFSEFNKATGLMVIERIFSNF